MTTRPTPIIRGYTQRAAWALALAALALAVLTVARPAVAQSGWTERHLAAIDARLLVHDKLQPLATDRPVGDYRMVARWRWPHAKTIYVSIETIPLAADKPITSLLEEMDGKPRREPRADGLPAIRTEMIFEGVLERHFWVHDRARGRVVRISIAILSVDNWMERKPADIRKEFADPLWVPTKMFRSLRFDPAR